MLQWTWWCRYLFHLVFSFSSGKYPEVELLAHMVVLFLIFWGNSILFFTVAAPIYTPIKSVRGSPFLYILVNICYLWSFWLCSFWQVWGDITLWFWFAFLWWLMMLSIFPCACWPSVCLLWKTSIQIFCLFNWVVCFFDTVLYELFVYFGY